MTDFLPPSVTKAFEVKKCVTNTGYAMSHVSCFISNAQICFHESKLDDVDQNSSRLHCGVRMNSSKD